MTRVKEVLRNAVMGGKLFHVIVLFGEIEYVLLIYLHQTSSKEKKAKVLKTGLQNGQNYQRKAKRS